MRNFLQFIFYMIMLLFVLESHSSYANEKIIKISDDLELKQLSENVFIHVSYGDFENYKHVPANGLIYINKGKAFIIDTPWKNDQTENLINWLKDSLKTEINGVIVNHWHVDCMGGLKAVKKRGITSYANKLTREIAKSKDLPVPDIAFQDSLELELGDKKVYCYYLGAGHTTDNIVVWMPADNILFAGCMVKTLAARGLGYTGDADLKRWPFTLKKLLKKFPASAVVIPGHGPHGDMALVRHTIELLEKSK